MLFKNLKGWHKTFDICRAPHQFMPYASQDWICHNCPCSAFAHLQNVAMLTVKAAPLCRKEMLGICLCLYSVTVFCKAKKVSNLEKKTPNKPNQKNCF